jgi:prolyl-tRNA synthetase
MLLSRLFTKTSKVAPSDADSVNAALLTRAGFVHKTMAGVYSFLPLGLRVLRKIETIIREEMDVIGAQEILMSGLSPRELWEKTGRWESFDALFHVPAASESRDEREFALNPTHEELVVPIVKHHLQSYKDLPFSCYQIQTKFRNEPRAKSGVLRGREFIMKDLYSFHRDDRSLEEYYDRVQTAYEKILARMDLVGRTYFTYATGGSFSPYSHEYQVLLPQGEDVIFISEEAEKNGKRIAINREIYEPGKTTCPLTGGMSFREARASEAANIFKLGTRFSEPCKLAYTDEEGKTHPVIMGCYGMGVTRLLGILAEAFADEAGLVWPASVAPAHIHIIPIAKKRSEDSFEKATHLYEKLNNEKVECLLDDRIDLSVGQRLADADLIGVPKRIIISPNTLEKGNVELKNRSTGNVEFLSIDRATQSLVS